MATSGTYAFNLTNAQLTTQAFHMCGIRPAALKTEHMESARTALNLTLVDFSNRGVNLWEVVQATVPYVTGQAQYTAPANLVDILDLYMTIGTGATATNRYLLPVGRTEFASYPNPQQQAIPTVYWHNRQAVSPVINFYPTPDGNEVSFTYYALSQIQDAALTNGQNPNVPYLFLNALAKQYAFELAIMWAPDRASGLSAAAEAAWTRAAEANTENAAVYMAPQVSSYWRT